jgi:hypothetical protein
MLFHHPGKAQKLNTAFPPANPLQTTITAITALTAHPPSKTTHNKARAGTRSDKNVCLLSIYAPWYILNFNEVRAELMKNMKMGKIK